MWKRKVPKYKYQENSNKNMAIDSKVSRKKTFKNMAHDKLELKLMEGLIN
jgi:hypothetical protein